MATKLPAVIGMSPADQSHFQAKAVLRAAAAYVAKGVQVVHFYAPPGDLMIYDGADPTGGEVFRALKRFTGAFAGPATFGSPRPLTLVSVANCAAGVQFQGDGTAAHPPLSNREVVAFFPFQIDDKHFVAPVYVMTRNLATAYQPAKTDVTRYDIPSEPYEVSIEGVAGATAVVTATDPLTASVVDVQIVRRSARGLVVSVPLTRLPAHPDPHRALIFRTLAAAATSSSKRVDNGASCRAA
jgi:hypothetical protein